LSMAIGRLLKDGNYGTLPEDSLSAPAPDGTGWLSFDARQARQWRIPRSTHNLTGSASIPGAGDQVVPAASAHLVAVGRCNGVERTVEVILHLPVFPYAAASDGPIVSPGGLLVGAVSAEVPATSPPESLLPASLFSNSPSDSAVVLGAGSYVQGDLIAVGQVRLEPPDASSVTGRLRSAEEPQAILRMPLDSYDPRAMGKPFAELQPAPPSTVTGVNRASSGLLVDGDLKLQGALIYVEGDAVIRGSLKGEGILAASGSLDVGDQVSLASESHTALLCGGTLRLRGRDRAGSFVRGMLYAEGGIEASGVTLQGVLVAPRDERREPASVRLSNCALLYDGEAAQVTVPGWAAPLEDTFFVTYDGTVRRTQPPSLTFYVVQAQRTASGYGGSYEPSEAMGGFGGDFNLTASLDQLVSQISAQTRANPTQVRQRLNQTLGAPTAPGLEATVDPSRLLPLEDRYRILLWRETP
ncbi:MAG: hypothetical protein AB1758_17040, partial [Candidatus Eremiobacterota bacterium]